MPEAGDAAEAVLELLPELALALRATAPHEQARRERPQLRPTARRPRKGGAEPNLADCHPRRLKRVRPRLVD
jgi:hypothetical protein